MAYSFKRSITIDHTKVPNTDQTNFPLAFVGTYAGVSGAPDLRTVGNGGDVEHGSGWDIAFFADEALTTPLDFELANYDPASGFIEAHVRIPTVATATDTVIYLAYGDSGISTYQGDNAGVWANDLSVYHFGDGVTFSAVDSVGGLNGTNSGVTAAGGKLGGGGSYDGAADHIDFGDVNDLSGAYTISAWFQTTDASLFLQMLVAKYDQSNTSTGLSYYFTLISGVLRGFFSTDGSLSNTKLTDGVTTVSNNTWYLAHVTWSGTTTDPLKVYLNGVNDSASPANNATGSPFASTTKLLFGARAAGAGAARYLSGLLDETRISNVERSADWIATEYNNQSSPSTFYSIGAGVVSVAFAGTIPLQSLAGTVTVRKAVSFAGTIPLQSLAAVVGVAPPVFNASFAGTVPVQSLAVVVAVVKQATFAATIPVQALAAVVGVAPPVFNASFVGTIPVQALAGTVTFTKAVAFAGSVPVQVLAAAVGVAPPVFNVSFAATIPVQSLAATVTFTKAVAFAASIPIQSLASVVDITAPGFTATFAGTIPLQSLAGTVTVRKAVAFAGTVPLQALAAVIDAEPPVFAASFVATVPLQSLVSVVAVVKQASFAATVPLQSLAAVVETALPNFAVTFGATIPLQSLAATVTRTVPVFEVQFAATVPLQALSAGLFLGELIPLDISRSELSITQSSRSTLTVTRRTRSLLGV